MSFPAYQFALSYLLLLSIGSCNKFVDINKSVFTITSIAVENGKVHFSGTGLTQVVSAAGNSSNLDGFSMKIVEKTSTSLMVELNHASLNSLEIARGTVLSFLLSNGHDQTVVNLTVAPVVPTGAIVAFNGACPTGWSELASARGRLLVGEGTGNTDALGAALTARTLSAVGGLEYTTALPANDANNADQSIPAITSIFGIAAAPTFIYSVAPDATLSGAKADSNLPPYVVVRNCQKI